jgi:formiminotetrahydrofolate cyclodeaminase
MMETFQRVLDPEDSTVGGGSASAIAGAMAGALLSMVARLSRPTSDAPAADAAFLDALAEGSLTLSRELGTGSSEDAGAFGSVRDAYRLPRGTPAEKEARGHALRDAWAQAAKVPLENARRCLKLGELCVEAAGAVNPKVRSDFVCAALLARAGLLGCLENVEINLPSLADDRLAGELAEEARALRRRGEAVAVSLGLPAA